MNIDFPEPLRAYVPQGASARLVAGTFSMAHQRFLPVQGRQLSAFSIQFRNALGNPNNIDHIETGSLNPSAIAHGSNQLVLLVVDVPESTNAAERMLKLQANKIDGGSAVVACWAPDGAAGRFLVEQENHFISGWLLSATQDLGMGLLFFGGAFAFAALFCIVAVVLPFLAIFAIPIGIYAGVHWSNSQKKKGRLLDLRSTQHTLQQWAIHLTESGLFQQKFNQAFEPPVAGGARL